MKLNEGVNKFITSNTSNVFRKGVVLQQAWEKIAPNLALEHTDNVVFSNKKPDSIVIYVDSAHIAANLSMSKEYYRQMMEHETNYKISDIFFLVSKDTKYRKKFIKQQEKNPWYIDDVESVPLDEGEMEYIKMSVDGIENQELKETLLKALISDLEWKKGIKESKSS